MKFFNYVNQIAGLTPPEPSESRLEIFRPWLTEICNTPVTEPPSPWVEVTTPLIGGLVEIGFSKSSKYLLVITWDGRGVLDCSTGEKVARDRELFGRDEPWYDSTYMTAQGIGPIADEKIALTGLWGGGLRHQTDDGWLLESETLDWPIETFILTAPGQKRAEPFNATLIEQDSDILAFGFSYSGEHLVLAQSHTLRLWKRDYTP